MTPFRYERIATDGAARRGRLHTAHGTVETPAFMPVGTAGTVKAMLPDNVRGTGAEVVLEGYVDPGERRVEGPFGDHTGYYSPAEEFPVFHVTCVTHRRKPIYPSTIVGRLTFAITDAVVNDFPDPVMPSSVWKRSPRSSPCANASIAAGWSPAGDRSDTSSSAGMPEC